MTAVEPTRPMLRYHGGKWLLAPWRLYIPLTPDRTQFTITARGRDYVDVKAFVRALPQLQETR